MTVRPPEAAERLLSKCSRPEFRADVLGDLGETFAAKASTNGLLRARVWYWRQAASMALPCFLDRWRDEVSHTRRDLSHGWMMDLTIALRAIRRNPAFGFLVMISFAVGIGASTAMFTLVHALLLRPLPFPNSEQLVEVYSMTPSGSGKLSIREVADLNEAARNFEGFALYKDSAYNLGDDGSPAEHLLITRTSQNLFSVLGVPLALGSTWSGVNDRSRSFVVILTHELWLRRFGADPGIIGKQVLMDGFANTVAGVLPPGFTFPVSAELFRCWGISSDIASYEQRDRREASVVGRLKPGIDFHQGQSEIEAIGRRLATEHPETNAQTRFGVRPLRDAYVGETRPYLALLSAAVAFLLLIACSNTANLMLLRGAARRQEMAVRTAIGAARVRVMRQMLTEVLILAMAGGVAGLFLSIAAVRTFSSLAPIEFPAWMPIRTDTTVLAYAFIISISVGIVAAVLPAFQVSRNELADRLKDGMRVSVRGGLVRVLIIGQVAFSVVLLVGAGLMTQSFQRIRSVGLGFDESNLVKFHVGLSWKKYDLLKARLFQKKVIDGLQRLPGVTGVAFNTSLPLTGTVSVPIALQGQTDPQDYSKNPLVSFQQVNSDYHRIMKIPLIRGRLFEAGDNENGMKVALISQRLAERLWPGQEAIGKTILPDVLSSWKWQWSTIVGVVGNVKRDGPAEEPGMDVYVPFSQAGAQYGDFAIRTSENAAAIYEAIRTVVAEVDRGEPISQFARMEDLIATTVANRRLAGSLFIAFGFLALLLAAIGVYGVISQDVRRRQAEIGIRLALGGRPTGVLHMVLSNGLRLVSIGTAIGLALAMRLGRFLEGFLFGTSARDPATFVAVPALLGLVGLIACAVPAIRASRVDPLQALRRE
jgi:putative ABC transport system permease protein